jgi:purine-binding chemotaxis protein CheW
MQTRQLSVATPATSIRPANRRPPGAINVPGAEMESLVTFRLANQTCGLPVATVRDVLAGQKITRIPLAPTGVAGSLNLRGRIVTAINVRDRLRLPASAGHQGPMSVVVEHGGELYALLVDEVAEVIRVEPSSVERTPATLAPAWAQHSAGIYRLDHGLLILLDVAKLLAVSPVPAAGGT